MPMWKDGFIQKTANLDGMTTMDRGKENSLGLGPVFPQQINLPLI